MSWYKQSMPTVKEISAIVGQICSEIKLIGGVTAVHIHGSYAENVNRPTYVVKDLDIIASTKFDSGDLLAIDNSKYSALRTHPSELEDEGFNPHAVAFTKRFLTYEKYNVDHWATSSDGKLLHWGACPENEQEWASLHAEAEAAAEKITGHSRHKLPKTASDRRAWRELYDQHIAKFISSKSIGWFLSEHTADEIIAKALEVK
jgi:hypothetical protein